MYVYLAKNVIDLAEGAEQLNDRKQKKLSDCWSVHS
jgi:hypothetical protein